MVAWVVVGVVHRAEERDSQPQLSEVSGNGGPVLGERVGDFEVVVRGSIVSADQGDRAEVVHSLRADPVESVEQQRVASVDDDQAPCGELRSRRVRPRPGEWCEVPSQVPANPSPDNATK